MIVSFSTYGNIPHGLAVHDVNGYAPNRSCFLKTGNGGGSRQEADAGGGPSDGEHPDGTLPGLLFGFGHLQHSGGFHSDGPETEGESVDGTDLAGDSDSQHKNCPRVKTITIIAHHVNYANEYLWPQTRCPEVFYYCPCMTNSSLASALQPSGMLCNYYILILKQAPMAHLVEAIRFFISRTDSVPQVHPTRP